MQTRSSSTMWERIGSASKTPELLSRALCNHEVSGGSPPPPPPPLVSLLGAPSSTALTSFRSRPRTSTSSAEVSVGGSVAAACTLGTAPPAMEVATTKRSLLIDVSFFYILIEIVETSSAPKGNFSSWCVPTSTSSSMLFTTKAFDLGEDPFHEVPEKWRSHRLHGNPEVLVRKLHHGSMEERLFEIRVFGSHGAS